MIDLDTARRSLLDSRQADELRATTARRNSCASWPSTTSFRKHRLAYLADEVGMGKRRTWQTKASPLPPLPQSGLQGPGHPAREHPAKVAEGAHDLAAHNVRFDDLRMRARWSPCPTPRRLRQPARACPRRASTRTGTSFVRMSSFSLPVGKASEGWTSCAILAGDDTALAAGRLRPAQQRGSSRGTARALCCALPKFDLVIVDEAHNLKHGFNSLASRNQVLAEAFGRHAPRTP